MKSLVKVSLGGDPEVFLKINGKYVSSDRFLPPKEKPRMVSRGKIYNDGFQAEIGLDTGVCKEQFSYNVMYSMRNFVRYLLSLDKINSEIGAIKTIELDTSPIISVTKSELAKAGKRACEFGCEPDYSAWDEDEEIAYPDAKSFLKRFAGGHIHVGYGNSVIYEAFLYKPENILRCVRAMDIFVGIPSVAFTQNNRELEKERRKYYGQAGRYRKQPWGFEYRALSPFWINHTAITSIISDFTRIAVTSVFRNDAKSYNEISELITEDEIRHIINNADVKKAKELTRETIIPFLIKEFGQDRTNTNFRPLLLTKELIGFIGLTLEKGWDGAIRYLSPASHSKLKLGYNERTYDLNRFAMSHNGLETYLNASTGVKKTSYKLIEEYNFW